MTTQAASKLDTAKFQKVCALMRDGATEGERAAAKHRAETMAAKAGMTLQEAVSNLDAATTSKPASFFDGFDDWMEEKEPGWKAERAERDAERERERYEIRQEALKEFGSEDAVFAENDRERLLRETLEPLADRKRFANSGKTYISGYAGWTCGNPTPPLWEALERAFPLPTDVRGAWQEYQEWKHLDRLRYAFYPGHEDANHVRARRAALEKLLDDTPAINADDFAARLAWLEEIANRDYSRDHEEDAGLAARLRADFAALRRVAENVADRVKTPVHSGRRTNAAKRAAVLSMLDIHPELSDREIARRVGVSPQTVNTWRKKSAPDRQPN